MPEKKNAKKEITDEKQSEETKKQSVEIKKAVIYLGPVITGVAIPGTVYRNGLTPQLKKAVEELPTLNRLLVEVSMAGKVQKELRDAQSAAAICYQKALEYANKKGTKG